jgi:GTPase SAR1 family protein
MAFGAAPMYYRGAAAAIIVYDITRAATFQTLKNWVRELQQLGPENIVIAICGNKNDLEDRRVRCRGAVSSPVWPCLHAALLLLLLLQEVSTSEAKAYAGEIGALFIETSAKANRNVQEMFMEISRRLPAPQEAAFDDGVDLGGGAGGKPGKSGKDDKKPGGGCC